MELNDAVSYYTDLLQSTAPFGETLAWTVVRPVEGPLPSVEDVASRLTGGGRPVLVESDEEFTEEAVFMEGWPVYLEGTGSAIMLTEPSGFSYAARQQVMAWLSQDAQVWHLSWNVAGIRGLEYAAHGQYLARVPSLEPESLHGVDPGALEEEVAALEAVADAPWPARQATAMAVVEARTGARLPEDWYEHPRTVAIVDPLLDGECPPIGLRHHEPDLDARLRLAAPERRRTILLHLIDVLAERFGLGSAAVTRARRAAHDRLPIDADLLRDVAGEWEALGQRWAGQGTTVREQADGEWRRWVAANGVRHGLRSLNEGASILDGLTYARFALSDEWPGIRAWIRAELRSGLPGSR